MVMDIYRMKIAWINVTKVRHLPKAAFANLPVVSCMLRQAADKENGLLVTRLPVKGAKLIDSPAECSGTVIGATWSGSPIVPDLRDSPEHLTRWLMNKPVSASEKTNRGDFLPRQTKG